MLLAEGHLLYNGPADAVVGWMEGFGLRVPFGTSIADFVLDTAMGEAGGTKSGKTGDAAVKELWTAWEARASGGGALPAPQQSAGGEKAAGGRRGPQGGDQHLQRDQRPAGGGLEIEAADGKDGGGAAAAAPADRQKGPGRVGASYRDQVAVLTGRALKVRRFEQMTFSNYFQLLFVAAVAGLVWWQRGSTYTVKNGADVLGRFCGCLVCWFSGLLGVFGLLPWRCCRPAEANQPNQPTQPF
jgi:hypothetical protein